jgi:hypothetical protein
MWLSIKEKLPIHKTYYLVIRDINKVGSMNKAISYFNGEQFQHEHILYWMVWPLCEEPQHADNEDNTYYYPSKEKFLKANRNNNL